MDTVTELFSVKSLAEVATNLALFVPLVLLFGQGWKWNRKAIIGYLRGSLPIAFIGSPIYVWLLTHVTYPLIGQ